MSQQVPNPLQFGNTNALNALDLSNFIDQSFVENPVDEIPVSLSAQSAEDLKLDNKLNVNIDNYTTVGAENLRALTYPADKAIPVDISTVIQSGNEIPTGTNKLDGYSQGTYTVEMAGWFCVKIEKPIIGDEIILNNALNGLNDVAACVDASQYLVAKIPVSKYQVIEIKSVLKPTGTSIRYLSANATMFIIPSGTEANLGETLAYTRDYKSIMAGIGFPSATAGQSMSLPATGAFIIAETDGYYSFRGKLAINNFFQMYTDFTGVDVVYDGSNRQRYCTLGVSRGTKVYFDYAVVDTSAQLLFTPAVGNVTAND